ncbi:hypothetical protein DSO57_1031498 [Entomophthora muscae]|nr:hypothetical protein DSO57_1031498 [Entomophthora muscae]
MIGPALPPHLLKSKTSDKVVVSEQATAQIVSPQLPTSAISSSAPRRVVGPTLPSNIASQQKPVESDSDDEMIGPMPPTAEELKASALDSKLAEIRRRAHPDEMNDEKPTRGEWMLIPPESRILGDPLKVTARQFNRTTVEPKDSDKTLWTETPEQRRERLLNGGNIPEEKKSRAPKRPIERKMDLNEGRSASLLELHQSKVKAKSTKKNKLADDHPANRRFDWEKDMSIKSLDPKSQRELLKKAGSLSDRFSRGSN